jgi:lysine 2,3-aminomutase
MSRDKSLERARELKNSIKGYLDIKDNLTWGLKDDVLKKVAERREKIMNHFNITIEEWTDHEWQLKNKVSDVETLEKLMELTSFERETIEKVGKEYRWGLSPYYLSLIDPEDSLDPVRLLSLPTLAELEGEGDLDPMGEEFTNPAGSITRRYPDRLIINLTNECAMYCRHCQRRRNIGEEDSHRNRSDIEESIEYIRSHKEIRDVLLTGGDALAIGDDRLEYILKSLREIDHLEIIRLGTRMPVTLPQRITDDLVNMIKKYHPIYVNTHFNTPNEVTPEAKEACEKLANAGIPLGNQAVLLNGINNDKYVMRLLNHELLKIRVKPYYIFHAKHVKGTTHFNTSINDGLEIMEYLRGYTSGMAIPTYIVNAPKGKGKTPLAPQYLISQGTDYAMIRTWEGNVIKYENHPTLNIKDILDIR